MRYMLKIAHQPASGASSEWTRGTNQDRPYTSRAHARAGLVAYKRRLQRAGWVIADGCDFADSFALTTPGWPDNGARLIAEVAERA